MIHIAICDDEEKFVSHLTGLIRQHTAERIRKQDGDRAGVFGASFRPVPQQLSGESRLCEGS